MKSSKVKSIQWGEHSTGIALQIDGTETNYIARHPEIEGCFSDGATLGEALANLAEVTEMILDHLRANHLPIPHPKPLITPVEKFALPRIRSLIGEAPEPNLEIETKLAVPIPV